MTLDLGAETLRALESAQQGIAQPNEDSALERHDGSMEHDAADFRTVGEHREGQQKVEGEVVQKNGDRCEGNDPPVTPGNEQGQSGEEIHMHVRLPLIAHQQVDQQGGFPHQGDGGHITGRWADTRAPPGQVIGERQDDRESQRSRDSVVEAQTHHEDEWNVHPE
jgi:hypothetical protein